MLCCYNDSGIIIFGFDVDLNVKVRYKGNICFVSVKVIGKGSARIVFGEKEKYEHFVISVNPGSTQR